LNRLLLCSVTIDEVFARPSQHNLPSNADLRIFFESDRRFLLVAVVKNDRYAGFGYSCLSALVDKILEMLKLCAGIRDEGRIYLEILRANCAHIRDTQNKTY